jgi:predicted RNase H-like HicB family nuclease
MSRYTVIVYPYGEEEGYLALVPSFPECESHGDTADEALARATDAITRRIAQLKEIGQPAPEEEDAWRVATIDVPD